MSQGEDSLRATDTIYMFPFNGKIQPECCPCVTYATVPCCTSRWSVMDLLRWAHLFLHEDDVAVWLCWESERDLPRQHSNQQLAQWNTISSLEFSPSCHHVVRWRHKAWYLETCGFILKTIQWHIHAGPRSLVNCLAGSLYEAFYKVLMNINESGCRPYGWPRPWWWSVYPRDTPTLLRKFVPSKGSQKNREVL